MTRENGGDGRIEKIDDAICAASQLIAALLEHGPVNSRQARVIIEAGVRAAVSNAEFFEIRERAKVIAADMSKAEAIPKIVLKNRKKGQKE